MKPIVIEISDDDEDDKNSNKDKVASPSPKVPPNPPMRLPVHCLQPVRCSHWTQSRKLLTYFFSFGAFAALAKAFAGEEFGQNPRGCGLNSGRASPPEIF